tara:strand:- start:891 stop:1175 length:285 start_codon:yes stop_codon:yes gene_type:complete
LQLNFSPRILAKLEEKHSIKQKEVFECFFNREHNFLLDTRENNKTNPATQWFISETDKGKKLKICFIPIDGELIIKTAYPPSAEEIRIYGKYAV